MRNIGRNNGFRMTAFLIKKGEQSNKSTKWHSVSIPTPLFGPPVMKFSRKALNATGTGHYANACSGQ